MGEGGVGEMFVGDMARKGKEGRRGEGRGGEDRGGIGEKRRFLMDRTREGGVGVSFVS